MWIINCYFLKSRGTYVRSFLATFMLSTNLLAHSQRINMVRATAISKK